MIYQFNLIVIKGTNIEKIQYKQYANAVDITKAAGTVQ
jgi:hypothetical protein